MVLLLKKLCCKKYDDDFDFPLPCITHHILSLTLEEREEIFSPGVTVKINFLSVSLSVYWFEYETCVICVLLTAGYKTELLLLHRKNAYVKNICECGDA